jgi:hypothetical protein
MKHHSEPARPLTADDWQHTALIDELVSAIEPVIASHDPTVYSAVLATLLARLLSNCPVVTLRPVILREHLKLMHGMVELYDLQNAGGDVH